MILTVSRGYQSQKWLWLKIKQEGLRRFWSMFPLPRSTMELVVAL